MPVGLGHRRRFAPAGALPSGVLFDWDASAQAPGAAVLTGTGLGIDRTATATVQMSATSISSLAALIAANAGRIFDDGVQRGLLIEEARNQYVARSHELTDAAWLIDAGGVTSPGAVGPDGLTAAQRIVVASGNNSVYQFPALPAGTYCMSEWLKEYADASTYNLNLRANNGANPTAAGGTTTASWARKNIGARAHASGSAYVLPLSGRDDLAYGGPGAAARDALVSCVQVENGPYPTSYIPNTGTGTVTRDFDVLYHSNIGALLHNGRLSLHYKLYMSCASTQIADFVNILDNVGGVVNVSLATANRMFYFNASHFGELPAWNAGDVVDLYVALGGGSIASRWKARVNAGTATGATGVVQAAITNAVPRVDLLSRQSLGRIMPCALMRFTAYDTTTLPAAWAAA